MSLDAIIEEALELKPQERYMVIESLNKPSSEIEKLWLQESQNRLQAYKQNKTKTLPYKQLFDQ